MTSAEDHVAKAFRGNGNDVSILEDFRLLLRRFQGNGVSMQVIS